MEPSLASITDPVMFNAVQPHRPDRWHLGQLATSLNAFRVHGFTLVELLLTVTILGILLTISVATYSSYRERMDIMQARSDIQMIESLIERYYTENNRYPDALSDIPGAAILDPWGHAYEYLNITTTKGNGKVRKDHNLVPLNSDFDLYSMGEDGRSVSPLTASASRDDIVRANNGGFVGLASEY